jgi:signal transduction histidine kinase
MRFNFWSWLGLAANLITIAVTLAFLALILGLGQRQRGNRSFALFLALLLGYIGGGQSTQVLLWLGQGSPARTLQISSAFFFFQGIALFNFAGRLIGLKRPQFNMVVGIGLITGLGGLVPLLNDRVLVNPSLSHTGLLRWDTISLAYYLMALVFLYLVAAPVLLLVFHHQVPHPALIIGTGIITVAEIAGVSASLLAIPFPVLALGVISGIAILGTSMVYYQLFKPLNDMTQELRVRQADLEERNFRLEEANVKLRDLDEWREKMTQMVIHDLRNPLNVISVVLNQFKTNLTGHVDEALLRLLRSALISERRIQSLVSSMLDMHRLEEGQLPINPTPFDLSLLVDECVQAAAPLLTLYDITVDIDKPGAALPAYADPTITTRVVSNLLENAVKFSPSPGTVDVRIDAGPDDLQTSIRDSGPGIAPVHQQQIFEKFFQIRPEAEKIRAGVGLGLSFCKLALEAQGGRIWVESDGRTGTTFFLTLPTWQEPATERTSPSGTESSAHA